MKYPLLHTHIPVSVFNSLLPFHLQEVQLSNDQPLQEWQDGLHGPQTPSIS
jgi:hypothetical protein